MSEDEQAFWDMAFCAVLTNANGGSEVTVEAAFAARAADAALSARRLRTEKDKP